MRNIFINCNIVAKYIIYILNSQKININHLKLQNLLFFSQKNSLENYSFPLFYEDFEIWKSGPVLFEVYNKYSCYGWNNIPKLFFKPLISYKFLIIINEILDKYKFLMGEELNSLVKNKLCWEKKYVSNIFYNRYSNAILKKENIKIVK